MTEAELQDLDRKIREKASGTDGKARQRLLFCALNPLFLSVDEEKAVLESNFREETLLQSPWVLAVLWAKLFYSKSDAKDYQKVLTESLPVNPMTAMDRIHELCGWFPPADDILSGKMKNTYRFQAECWLTGAAGHSSKIWKAANWLSRQIETALSEEEFFDLGEDDDDLPPPVVWLLRKQDQNFYQSLKWLRFGGDGNPVSEVLARNEIGLALKNRDYCTTSLGIVLNPRRPTGHVALKLKRLFFANNNTSSTRQLAIKQGSDSRVVFHGEVTRNVSSICLSLNECDPPIKLLDDFRLKFGNIELKSSDMRVPPWDSDELLLIHSAGADGFCAFAKDKPSETVFLRSQHLYVAARPGEQGAPRLSMGPNELASPSGFWSIESDNVTRRVYRYTIGNGLVSISPLQETSGERIIAYVGRKPYLEAFVHGEGAIGAASGWKIIGDDKTELFLEDAPATVSALNFPDGNDIEWECSSSSINYEVIPATPNTSAQLVVHPSVVGEKFTVRARSQSHDITCRKTLMFVPSLDRNGNVWKAPTSGTGFPVVLFKDAKNAGLEAGELWSGNKVLNLSRPIQMPSWGWRRGIGSLGGYKEAKEFQNHAAVEDWILEVALPNGWSLQFKGQQVLSSSSSVALDTLLDEHTDPDELQPALLGAMDTIEVVGACGRREVVARIKRLPSYPVLGTAHAEATVYTPEQYDVSSWSLLHISEESLLSNDCYVTPLSYFGKGVQKIPKLPPQKEFIGSGEWICLVQDNPEIKRIDISDERYRVCVDDCVEFEFMSICALKKESEEHSFPHLLELWSGTSISTEEASALRSKIDIIDQKLQRHPNSHQTRKLFQRARENRKLLGFADTVAIKDYFCAHAFGCLDSQKCLAGSTHHFDDLLDLLLQCGFNWVAEPNWIEKIEQNVRVPIGRRFTRRHKSLLTERFPLHVTLQHIHEGKFVDIPRFDNKFAQGVESGIVMAFPTSKAVQFRSGQVIVSLSRDQEITLGEERPRKVEWPEDFKTAVRMLDAMGDSVSPILKITDRERAKKLFRKRPHPEDVIAITNTGSNLLQQMFTDCLDASSGLIGNKCSTDESQTKLAALFHLCHEWLASDEEDASQDESDKDRDDWSKKRLSIYHSSVVSRLNAWRNSDTTNCVWPLDAPDNYNRLCAMIAKIWRSSSCWRIFAEDLARVEWLLTWFKTPSPR